MSFEGDSADRRGPIFKNARLVAAALGLMVPGLLSDAPAIAQRTKEAPLSVEAVPKKKPAILFIHGWRGQPSDWAVGVKQFTDNGYVAESVSLPGDDESPIDNSTMTAADFFAVVNAACERVMNRSDVDTNDVTVAATSFGAYLASMLPPGCQVTRLILHAPASYSDAEKDIPMKTRIEVPEVYVRTQAFRKDPDSTSAVIQNVRRFPGSVMCVYDTEDAVVPRAVVVNYCKKPNDSGVSKLGITGTRDVVDMEGVPHTLDEANMKKFLKITRDWLSGSKQKN